MRKGLETSLGGANEAFPETAWSTIISTPGTKRRDQLRNLCTQYWRPVYRYARAAWKKSVEDAKDLTQEFFFHLLEHDVASKYQQEKGRFRAFLKGALQLFLAERHRSQKAQKRGGGKVIHSLNVAGLETEAILSDQKSLTPDEVFNRQWAADVYEQGVGVVRKILTTEGREDSWKVYELYEFGKAADQRPTYAQVGEQTGLTESQVKTHLDFVREKLNAVIVEVIQSSVSTRGELLQEIRELFP